MEKIEGPFGRKRDDYNAALIAMNAIAPHVKEGTDLSLDQLVIKYGEQPDEERENVEMEPGEYWIDQSFFGTGPGSQYAGSYIQPSQ